MTDKELMALMLYGECRGESQYGKLCVASTVMNRLELAKTKNIVWFGDSIKSIIECPNQYQGFKLIDFRIISEDKAFQDCMKIAIAVIDVGIIVPDITHFAGDNNDLEKLLKLKYCFEVGKHRFYQEVY